MWAKNGSATLPFVLKSIDQVIPKDVLRNCIFVDDSSTDNSKGIAEAFGWQVYDNEGKGIGDGANTALKHVQSPYFISIEQDVILARDWWQKIPPHLNKPKVIAAQGIRLPNHPVLRKLQESRIDRYKAIKGYRITQSMDNTIYRTSIIRKLGGFPRLPGAGVDSIIVQKALKAGYRWITDYNVVSIHLRNGVWQDVKHTYWYGRAAPIVSKFDSSITFRRLVAMFLFSPIRGLHIMLTKSCPQMVFVYPLMRFMALKGYLESRSESEEGYGLI
jgi:glycosyltransferase involved in cell wall biosynthesis